MAKHKKRAYETLNAFTDYILTPPVSPYPRINGAKVFGVRPGAPCLFTVAASGQAPLTFSAEGLPPGLALDPMTGCISGVVETAGSYTVQLTVRNALGAAHRPLRLQVGDTICLTPPMGWNSWYCFSESVSAQQVREMAEAMVHSGLAQHGWSYINIDDCWQGERGGEFHALQGNERFPDLQALCDDIHRLGLKIGIYSTPWMGSYAGFPGGTCENDGGDYTRRALPSGERLQPAQLFGRYPGSIERGVATVAAHWFCSADARQWAAWGIDLVKYDWYPNDLPTTRRLVEDLRDCGRDIVLCLSNNAPFAQAEQLSALANLWRTTGDISDNWDSISRIGFEQGRWQPFCRPGHWNDPDMLQLGYLGDPNQQHDAGHPSRLHPDEQYTQMSLWALFSAPLLLSCDLRKLDAFTHSLLTNDEVIEVNQDPRGSGAHTVAKVNESEVWAKRLEDDTLAVGLFNRASEEQPVCISWQELGVTGPHRVRDLWRQQDLGIFTTAFTASVRPHGVVLLRLIPSG